jgi:hypothetical protein
MQFKTEAWRNIDNSWLFSAGSLALRLNSLTHNLSLILATAFENSKRVMLCPGDAEYRSWARWCRINWIVIEPGKRHFLQNPLRRTVFYKVANYISHNVSAKWLGVLMMEHSGLDTATLDYTVITPK